MTEKVIEKFAKDMLESLDYTAKVAPWFWDQPKALSELWRIPIIAERLKEDPAFFCSLNLRLPTGVFKPLDFQIQFLRDPSKRIAVCCGRQVGKTTMSAAKACHFAVTRDHFTVLVISKSQRQSMWMFDKIRSMFYWNPLMKSFLQFPGTTRTKLTIKNNSQIIALPTGPDGETILGITADVIIIDEANFIKPSIITETVFPMISSTDGYMIMLSTPEYAEHPFMRAIKDPQKYGYSTYHFPSSIAPLPSKEAKEKFLAEQKASIPFDEYQRQYLAILPDESNQLIATKYVRLCVDPTYNLLSEEDIFAERFQADWGGYDPGGKVNPAAFSVLKNDMVSVKKLDRQGKPVVKKQNAWRLVFVREKLGETYAEFTNFVQGAQQVLRLSKLGVDSKGVGGPLVEDLQHVLGKRKVEGYPITDRLKIDLFKWLRTCFEQQYLIIPDNDKIIRQVKALKWRWVKNEKTGKVRYEIYHPESIPDDIAFAIAIALYVAAQKRSRGVFIA